MMHAYSSSNVSANTSTMSVSVSEDDSSFDDIVLAPPISEVQVKCKKKQRQQRHNGHASSSSLSPSGVTSVVTANSSTDCYYSGGSNYSDISGSSFASTILSPPRITRRAAVEPRSPQYEEYGGAVYTSTAHVTATAPSSFTSTVPTVVSIDDDDENVELIYMDAMSCLKRLYNYHHHDRSTSRRQLCYNCQNCSNKAVVATTAHTIEDDDGQSMDDNDDVVDNVVEMNVIYYLESIPKMSYREMRKTLKEFNESHGLLILILSLQKYHRQSYRFVNATLHAIFRLLDEYLTSSQSKNMSGGGMELLFNKTETLRTIMNVTRYHCYNNTNNNNTNKSKNKDVDVDADEIPCSAVNILCCMTFIGGGSGSGQQEQLDVDDYENDDGDPNNTNTATMTTTEATSLECIDFIIEMMEYFPNAVLLQKACVSYLYIITILNVPQDVTYIQHEHQYLVQEKNVDQLLLNAHRLYHETMMKNGGGDGSIVDDTDVQCCQETLHRLLLSTTTTTTTTSGAAATVTSSSATTSTSSTPRTELSLD